MLCIHAVAVWNGRKYRKLLLQRVCVCIYQRRSAFTAFHLYWQIVRSMRCRDILILPDDVVYDSIFLFFKKRSLSSSGKVSAQTLAATSDVLDLKDTATTSLFLGLEKLARDLYTSEKVRSSAAYE